MSTVLPRWSTNMSTALPKWQWHDAIPGVSPKWMLPRRKPKTIFMLVSAFVLSLFLVSLSLQAYRDTTNWGRLRGFVTDVTTVDSSYYMSNLRRKKTKDQMHMIIPVSRSDPKLCKNLLSQTILDYPRPNIVMWNQTFDQQQYLGQGSHLAKITSVLAWLEDPANAKYDDDLVVMLDAFDMWFQLPPETLISRFYATLEAEDERVRQRMGRAARAEKIQTKVIFSASKRCGPNDIRSVACYPVPESPLPDDIYGNWTDTLDAPSRIKWAGLRQRHLVSGFAMGTVKDMRRVFQRASRKMSECLVAAQKGSKFTGSNCHRGSDQSFLNEMYGEQEYHREVMRRHHHNRFDEWMEEYWPDRAGSAPKNTSIEGHPIGDDPLNPDFDHMPMADPDYHEDRRYEFGIAVDYFSEFSHQTSNALHDTAYVNHSAPLAPQIENATHAQHYIHCNPKAPMPLDLPDRGGVLDLFPAESRPTWASLPLYSELCAGVVPVAAHHNWVSKWPITTLWSENWWTGHARMLLDQRRRLAGDDAPRVGGADTDTGESLTWHDLCPAEWDNVVFFEGGGKLPEEGDGH